MFGLFCGPTPASQNNPADAKPKEDGGALAKLKGLLGWEGGNVEVSGEKTTEKDARRTNQQSKRYGNSVQSANCVLRFVTDC